MKAKKRLLLALLVGLLILPVAAVSLLWRDRPGYESAYREIKIGMSRDQVEKLTAQRPWVDPESRAGYVLSVEWEGLGGGSWVPYPKEGKPSDPSLNGSLLWNSETSTAASTGRIEVRDRATGKLIAEGQAYGCAHDHVNVVYDPESGRVIEKQRFSFYVEPPWRGRLRQWFSF